MTLDISRQVNATNVSFQNVLLVSIALMISIEIIIVCHSTVLGQEFLTYKNNVSGIQIGYPGNWIYTDLQDGVTFIPANESKLDQAMLNQDLFLTIFKDSSVVYRNIPLESYLHYVETKFPDSFVQSTTPNKILFSNDVPAYEFYLTSQDYTKRGLVYAVIRDGEPYTVVYFALTDKFDRYLPTIMIMLSTFRFLD